MQDSPRVSPIRRLLRPRSVAIVGASAEASAPGARVLANLEQIGYGGAIHLVSRRAREIGGRACVPSIEDLPLGVDAAVLAVPESVVADAVKSCAARGIGGAVVFAAGFAETGAEGKAKQDRIAAIARDGGVALNGPNCMGFTNFVDRVSFSFGAVETEVLAAGQHGVAVIAQSGAMMGNIASALGAKGVPVNYTISTGNEAVTSAEDFLAEVIDDAATRVIVLFMEQIRRPAQFLELVARARNSGKPITLMHPGSSERGRQSAHSHTGAMAGDHAVMAAVTRHHGVVLVDTMDELIDTSMLLARWPEGAERGAAVISNSGAVRGIALDFGEQVGLEIPKLADATIAALRAIIPSFVPADNPLDLATAGMGQADIYGKTARLMLADDGIGCAVLSMVPGTPQLQMAKGNSLVPLVEAEKKPVAFVMMGDEVELVEEFTQLIRQSRIPFFRSPDRAMRAMAHLFSYGKRRQALKTARRAADLPSIPLPGIGPIAEYRAKAYFAGCGISVPPGALAKNVNDARAIAARIGFPVVMKIQSPAILHKSDIGGVAIGILNADMVDAAWQRLSENASRARPDVALDGILVEAFYAPGTEMIIGARRDPEWGAVVVVGLGGVWAEALKDIRIFPAGLSTAEIRDEIGRLKGARLFAGLRGTPPLDIEAPARIAATIGAVMLATPELEEIEINPLALREAGQGAIALDALMVVRDEKKRVKGSRQRDCYSVRESFMADESERLNTPISTKELERRWGAVRQAMEARGIDVLVMQNNNDFMGGYVKYFTDLPATNGYALSVVFPRDEDMTIINQGPFGTDRQLPPEGDGVRRGVKRVMASPSYASAPFTKEVDAALAEKAMDAYSGATIGLVGTACMPASFVDYLRRGKLSNARFVEASDLVDEIKSVKSAEEIALVRRTAVMQDTCMAAAFEAMQPGMKDIEVAAIAEHTGHSLGSEQGLFMCASGPIGTAPLQANRHFQNRTIRAGDQLSLLVESSGAGGFYTELGRTCVLGKASAEMNDEFAFVLEARNFTLKLLRPGASCKDIWDAYNQFMREHKRPEEKRLYCHGQGYDMVERPLVRFDEPMKLKANMIVSCHPTYALAGSFNWACDNYLITDNGVERLHQFPEKITELG